MCLHFALSEVFTLSKNCKICRLSAVIDRLLARVPATSEGFTRAKRPIPEQRSQFVHFSHWANLSQREQSTLSTIFANSTNSMLSSTSKTHGQSEIR